MSKRFKVKITWLNEDEEFVKEGRNDKIFPSRERAQDTADFFAMGMDPDDYRSIQVVDAKEN